MSWSASTGQTHRYDLWQAIDALTATQDGLDAIGEEQLSHQLHNAKAAAKSLCNSFPVGEWPILSVQIQGHVYTGPGSAASWLHVGVDAPRAVPEQPEQPIVVPDQQPEQPAEPAQE